MTDTPQTNSSLPWKTKLFMSAATTIAEAAQRRNGTINRGLLNLFDVRVPPTLIPHDGVASFDHTVDPIRKLKIRFYSPCGPCNPVMVYFHGGGFATNSAFSRPFDIFCRRISRHIPCHVISVNYRLSPEHRHPAAYDDGIDVLKWLDTGDLIVDLSAVFLSGDSAGANIAHHVARMAMALQFNRLSVLGLVMLQPFFGGEVDTDSGKRLDGKVPFGSREQMKWMWRSFLPEGSSLDHEVANVFGPGSSADKEDWGGFPVTMVVVGGRDTLQDRQRWYYQGLKRVGVDVSLVEFPNATRAFYCFPELADANKLLVDMDEFVKQQLMYRKTCKV